MRLIAIYWGLWNAANPSKLWQDRWNNGLFQRLEHTTNSTVLTCNPFLEH
jgi:hypothetical protein